MNWQAGFWLLLAYVALGWLIARELRGGRP